MKRRDFLAGSASLAASGVARAGSPTAPRTTPPTANAEGDRPVVQGIMTGDVTGDSAVFWAATDRPARLHLSWEALGTGGTTHTARGPVAGPDTDHTAQLRVTGLPPDATLRYSLRFEDLRTGKLSDPEEGQLRTAPRGRRDVRFVWGGDLCGQGWGIDPARGGYRIFDTMHRVRPDFLLFSGDRIYADQPLSPEVDLGDGTVWRNLVTPAVSRVAETLDDFRGRYRYHLLDEAYRRFHADVPLIVTWDDHEVIDNWSPGRWVRDDRYTVRDGGLLQHLARRAMAEHTPMRRLGLDWARVYRKIAYGPLLDVFVLDARSYRSENGANLEPHRSSRTNLLGMAQLRWLQQGLARSTATWKVIAMGQPIATRIWDDWRRRMGHDGTANTDGQPLGREHELAALLSGIARKGIRNVVWLSADVHYAAAHHFHPDRAAFTRFHPFWEFVAGPFHAGTFGPNELDDTFGPEVVFYDGAPEGQPGVGPAHDKQFFGEVHIAGNTGVMTVRLVDVAGNLKHVTTIKPEG